MIQHITIHILILLPSLLLSHIDTQDPIEEIVEEEIKYTENGHNVCCITTPSGKAYTLHTSCSREKTWGEWLSMTTIYNPPSVYTKRCRLTTGDHLDISRIIYTSDSCEEIALQNNEAILKATHIIFLPRYNCYKFAIELTASELQRHLIKVEQLMINDAYNKGRRTEYAKCKEQKDQDAYNSGYASGYAHGTKKKDYEEHQRVLKNHKALQIKNAEQEREIAKQKRVLEQQEKQIREEERTKENNSAAEQNNTSSTNNNGALEND